MEDDAADAELLWRRLSPFGVVVATVRTAAQAKEYIKKHWYDYVLLNLSLPHPEPDGIALIRWIRHQKVGLPIFVVSGAHDPRRREQAIEAGASGFFEKPFTVSDNQSVFNILVGMEVAYERGKKMRDWRTSFGGICAAVGTILYGWPIAVATAKISVPSELSLIFIAVGMMMQVFGTVFMALNVPDKNRLDKHLKECNGKS